MPQILSDFRCAACAAEFEDWWDREHPDPVKCPACGQSETQRLISGTRIDPRLGLDPEGFPTMGDKWARVRRERTAIEEKKAKA